MSCMADDELHSSSPLVNKENLNGCHDSYAYKPRMVYASSSREKIVDEKMSSTQSETNGDPRRDDFRAHGEGTREKSLFTHPQIPLSQSMLNHAAMKQKRKKAFKAHNMAKGVSQKAKKKMDESETS
ncbi:hypothetical protein O181_020282 [Austropuccinia psidii MF-1]|uniref:Uncharacterized protein n=1 Tax=Austropuccinia psidii MF-1 TaxID=1389203 RepID=A0A9Q3GV67_9BASI|nr:hypothetical protein [Austropuccinia psidii MF-1]